MQLIQLRFFLLLVAFSLASSPVWAQNDWIWTAPVEPDFSEAISAMDTDMDGFSLVGGRKKLGTFLAYLDGNGQPVWEEIVSGGEWFSQDVRMIAFEGKDAYLSGIYYGTSPRFWGDTTAPHPARFGIYIAKINPQQKKLHWLTTLPYSEESFFYQGHYQDGNIWIAGNTGQQSLTCLDTTGTILWHQELVEQDNYTGAFLAINQMGESIAVYDSALESPNRHLILEKYGPQGQIRWRSRLAVQVQTPDPNFQNSEAFSRIRRAVFDTNGDLIIPVSINGEIKLGDFAVIASDVEYDISGFPIYSPTKALIRIDSTGLWQSAEKIETASQWLALGADANGAPYELLWKPVRTNIELSRVVVRYMNGNEFRGPIVNGVSNFFLRKWRVDQPGYIWLAGGYGDDITVDGQLISHDPNEDDEAMVVLGMEMLNQATFIGGGATIKLGVWPNPAQAGDLMHLGLDSEWTHGEALVEWYSPMGQQVAQQQIHLSPGTEHRFLIPAIHTSGMYLLKIRDQAGRMGFAKIKIE